MDRYSVVVHSAAIASAIACAIACTPAAAAPQAYVASDGLDLNARFQCPQIRPCRTFAAAIGVVDAGGQIVAVDAADYGPVAINQSVSIIGNSQAAIVATSGTAITIAKAGVDVVLRGLDIRAVGGLTGISMTAGNSLAIEKCVISNFAFDGVSVGTPAAVRIVESVMRGNSNGASITGGASADVAKSYFMGNRGAGLIVNANGATTTASVTDSVASGNLSGFTSASLDGVALGRMALTRSTAANNRFAGFDTGPGALITVAESMATGNQVGFANVPGPVGVGIFESYGNNAVRQNDSATLGFITPASSL